MNEPLVSIVVPVYNGEKYLEETLNVLKNQTYKNFEVIMVDDISTDNSVQILEKFANEDERFKLIKRKTKGGTGTNSIVYGLQYCTGEYYSYLSQDDLISKKFLEKCVEKAVKTNAEIVLANPVSYYENKKNKKIGKFPTLGLYNLPVSNKKAFLASLKWHIGVVGIRSMELIRKLNYQANYYNADEFYSRKAFLLANKIVFANTDFYYRQDNAEAITKNIRYYTFDVLTTDIKLAELLIEYKYPKRVIDKRFKELLKYHQSWVDMYKTKNESFDESAKLYVKDVLNNAKLNLETIVKDENLFFSKLYLKSHKLEEIVDEQ